MKRACTAYEAEAKAGAGDVAEAAAPATLNQLAGGKDANTRAALEAADGVLTSLRDKGMVIITVERQSPRVRFCWEVADSFRCCLLRET